MTNNSNDALILARSEFERNKEWQTMSPHEALIRARAKIERPECFSKTFHACDEDGRYCIDLNKEVSWSAYGAVKNLPQSLYASVVNLLYIASDGVHPGDLPATAHSNILGLFDRAIAASAPSI